MLLFGVTAAITLALDQVTKAVVRSTMQPGASTPLLDGVFHLTHVRNTGAAFGLMPGRQPMFIAVTVAVLVGIALYLRFAMPSSRLGACALGLVAGGAVGNLIDRVATGRVTDFFEIEGFPVFNIADSGIVIGVAVLVILTLFAAPDGETESAVAESEA